MTFFFIGQLVRIIRAPACPEVVGTECTIIGEASVAYSGYAAWELSLRNRETGGLWRCKKEAAHECLAPAIPPEEAITESEAPVDCVTSQ